MPLVKSLDSITISSALVGSYNGELLGSDESTSEDSDSGDTYGSGKVDEKFDVIVDWIRTVYVAENKPLSISAIQTEHAIGFNKAKRIHNQLKKQGIIDKDGYIIN